MIQSIDMWGMCKCLKKPSQFIPAVKDVFNHGAKFLFNQTVDEGSEMMFAIGRLIGCIIKKPYVRIYGDSTALGKRRDNIMISGCATDCCIKRRI